MSSRLATLLVLASGAALATAGYILATAGRQTLRAVRP